MNDQNRIRLSTLKYRLGNFLWLILIVLCAACSEEESDPFSAYVDGYNHLRVSNGDLDLKYLFAYTEPTMNHVFSITEDSVAMELHFHRDSLSNMALEFFIIRFHYDKAEKTISNVSLFMQEIYNKNGVDTIVYLGEYVPGTSGVMSIFVPMALKVSKIRYSPEDNQISFDYTGTLEGAYNSLGTQLNLSGTLMAKCGP